MYRRALSSALMVLGLVAGLMSFSTSPAAAAGTCSIRMSSKLTVDKPYKQFPAQLATDCDSSGVDYASWDIRHAYYGPDDILIFDSGDTATTWDVYDWDHTGTYYVEPSSAYDADYTDLEQNTLTVSVRFGSRATLATSRSGAYVTLTSKASKYTPSAEGFRPWRAKAVSFSFRTCTSCAWKHLATPKTNKNGVATYRVRAAKARDYRAVTASASTVWRRTSAVSHR